MICTAIPARASPALSSAPTRTATSIRPATIWLAGLALSLIAGCSGPQAYGAGQAWQRDACNRIPDLQERARCLERAATSYEQYRRDAESAKGRR